MAKRRVLMKGQLYTLWSWFRISHDVIYRGSGFTPPGSGFFMTSYDVISSNSGVRHLQKTPALAILGDPVLGSFSEFLILNLSVTRGTNARKT